MTNESLPRLTVTEFNTEHFIGSTQYVEIDVLKFVRYEHNPKLIVVQVLDGENYVYLDDFDGEEFMNSIDLLIAAQEWIIKHVRIEDEEV